MLMVHHGLAPTQARFPVLSDVSDPLYSFSQNPDRPIVSIRFNSNGNLLEATGDTGSSLSYSVVGTWLNNTTGIDGNDWEVKFNIDSEDNGAAGTWTGATTDTFVSLDVAKTFTWTKDLAIDGTANSEVTITLRHKTNTSNSATLSNVSYNAEYSSGA